MTIIYLCLQPGRWLPPQANTDAVDAGWPECLTGFVPTVAEISKGRDLDHAIFSLPRQSGDRQPEYRHPPFQRGYDAAVADQRVLAITPDTFRPSDRQALDRQQCVITQLHVCPEDQLRTRLTKSTDPLELTEPGGELAIGGAFGIFRGAQPIQTKIEAGASSDHLIQAAGHPGLGKSQHRDVALAVGFACREGERPAQQSCFTPLAGQTQFQRQLLFRRLVDWLINEDLDAARIAIDIQLAQWLLDHSGIIVVEPEADAGVIGRNRQHEAATDFGQSMGAAVEQIDCIAEAGEIAEDGRDATAKLSDAWRNIIVER